MDNTSADELAEWFRGVITGMATTVSPSATPRGAILRHGSPHLCRYCRNHIAGERRHDYVRREGFCNPDCYDDYYSSARATPRTVMTSQEKDELEQSRGAWAQEKEWKDHLENSNARTEARANMLIPAPY